LPKEVVEEAGLIILAVPGFAWKEILAKIGPWVHPDACLGAIPGTFGFDWLARKYVGDEIALFGFQRSPYVSQTLRYGRSVKVTGVRGRNVAGVQPLRKTGLIAGVLSARLRLNIETVSNYLAITLNPGNTAFHSSRLYGLFSNWDPGAASRRCPLFYTEWDDAASDCYFALDSDIQAICKSLPLDLGGVQPIADHYGERTCAGLTARIRTLPALQGIRAPMSREGIRWQPDFAHRFFQEDMLQGLVTYRGIAEMTAAPTPAIDAILHWAESWHRKPLLRSGRLAHASLAPLASPQSLGIRDLDALVEFAIR
jgi:hypothetical protein